VIENAVTIIASRGYPRLPLEAAAERSRPRSQPGKGDAVLATTSDHSSLIGLFHRCRRLLTYARTTRIGVRCRLWYSRSPRTIFRSSTERWLYDALLVVHDARGATHNWPSQKPNPADTEK